jgi:hypothetical protein
LAIRLAGSRSAGIGHAHLLPPGQDGGGEPDAWQPAPGCRGAPPPTRPPPARPAHPPVAIRPVPATVNAVRPSVPVSGPASQRKSAVRTATIPARPAGPGQRPRPGRIFCINPTASGASPYLTQDTPQLLDRDQPARPAIRSPSPGPEPQSSRSVTGLACPPGQPGMPDTARSRCSAWHWACSPPLPPTVTPSSMDVPPSHSPPPRAHPYESCDRKV